MFWVEYVSDDSSDAPICFVTDYIVDRVFTWRRTLMWLREIVGSDFSHWFMSSAGFLACGDDCV